MVSLWLANCKTSTWRRLSEMTPSALCLRRLLCAQAGLHFRWPIVVPSLPKSFTRHFRPCAPRHTRAKTLLELAPRALHASQVRQRCLVRPKDGFCSMMLHVARATRACRKTPMRIGCLSCAVCMHSQVGGRGLGCAVFHTLIISPPRGCPNGRVRERDARHWPAAEAEAGGGGGRASSIETKSNFQLKSSGRPALPQTASAFRPVDPAGHGCLVRGTP